MAADGPTIRFRNYQPKSDELQGLEVDKPSVPTIEEQVGTTEAVHKDATQEPLLNLAPKKVNWDLKRDLEQPMKKLRAMTDRAIIELIRKRVESEEGEEPSNKGEGADLAAAVDQQQRVDADQEDED